MAAPLKPGLQYFSLDVDIFDNEDLFDLQNDYGPLGEVIYLRLLCLVYKNGYYYEFKSIDSLSAILIKSIGNKWTRGKRFVAQVIPRLAEYNLFDRELMQRGVLTSVGIQRRYLKAVKRRQSNIGKYWLLENESNQEVGESIPENPDTVYNNEVNVYSNSQNECDNSGKEKESKKEENILSLSNARARGKHQNVNLTDEQVRELEERGVPPGFIDHFSEKLHDRHYAYPDHFKAILDWWKGDKKKWTEQKVKKEAPPEREPSSFNTDEFFEAALRRSYGEQYDHICKNYKDKKEEET